MLFVAPAAFTTPTPLPNPCSLLTSNEVAPAVGGKPQSMRGDLPGRAKLIHACTWLGPPMGFRRLSGQLIVQVSRMTKARFLTTNSLQAAPISGMGDPAFATHVGLELWKNGIAVGLYSQYLLVNPQNGRALARAALSRL